IGAAAVHDDVLEIGVTLEEDRTDRLLEKFTLVVRRCDNRYDGPSFRRRAADRGAGAYRPWPALTRWRRRRKIQVRLRYHAGVRLRMGALCIELGVASSRRAWSARICRYQSR